MKRQSLWFSAPQQVEIKAENLPGITDDQVLVKTIYSAISAGTEMLVYKGQVPADMALDESIDSLEGNFSFPFKYGYTCVGEITGIGKNVDSYLMHKKVFSFHAHESHFLATKEDLIFLPDDLDLKKALFLPNMETAVNFIMDAQPGIGETALVLGQGIVGLLTTYLLAQHPIDIFSIDPLKNRQALSQKLGSTVCFDTSADSINKARFEMGKAGPDLLFELSGNPQALDLAIQLAGFNSRIIAGSWYGTKTAQLNLGGDFHRKRIKVNSSQVSTMSPHLLSRWDNKRRMNIALEQIRGLETDDLITHEFNFMDIDKAFRHILTEPDKTLQVIIKY